MTFRAACLLFLLAAAPAAAQPMPPPDDGPITLGRPAEALDAGPSAPRQQVFFSPAGEPFRAEPGAPYPSTAWFARADADHDGALTLAEFETDALAFFDALDVEGDRIVDGFETQDYEKAIAPEINSQVRGPVRPGVGPIPMAPPSRVDRIFGSGSAIRPVRGERPRTERQGAAQFGLLNEPHPVRGGDADLDQKVTRAEATAAARRRFKLLDEDADGVLRFADLPKTPFEQLYRAFEEEGRRRGAPPPIEMRLQSDAANAMATPFRAADTDFESP
ncbi:MAG: hypothetical protein ACOY4K_13460 [Pseudomonadota bacterium]